MLKYQICIRCKKSRPIYDPEGEYCMRCLNEAKYSFSTAKKIREERNAKNKYI
jgi:predicted amidophosphoribosyltransferase